MKFYNQKDYEELIKQKKINFVLVICFATLFAISLLVFILISSYKTRVLFSVIASLAGIVIVLFEIFFIGKYRYLKRLSNEYSVLLNSQGKEIKCEILECSDFLTTLPDKSRCYEVMVNVNETKSIYYLSEIFDRELIKAGVCKISVNSDYITGVEYES